MGKTVLIFLALLAATVPGQAKIPFFQYLQQSASTGEAESLFILGMTYRDGWDGTIKSGSISARWCDLAAEQGDQRPELVFGLLQKEKNRVLPDGAKAVAYLTQAAVQGDNYARVILGEMLMEGDGVPANWLAGVEWIRKSAHAGFSSAQVRLGVIYLVGDASLPKNEVEALAWFILAAEGGSEAARVLRDERTQLLGHEAAYQAVKRSRALLVKGRAGSEAGGG